MSERLNGARFRFGKEKVDARMRPGYNNNGFHENGRGKEMKYSHNPIISGEGICDPHLHVFGDKMYLYCSHDAQKETAYPHDLPGQSLQNG